MKKSSLLIAASCLFASAAQAEWQFEISPYVYFLNAKAEVNSALYHGTLRQSFSQIFKNLDNAFFLRTIARNDHWVIEAGAAHAKVSYDDHIGVPYGPQTINLPISAMAKYTALDLIGGYTFKPRENFSVDLMGGLRYWAFKSSLSFGPESEHPTKYWTQPLIVTRAIYDISPDFALVGRGELGTFSSDHSWTIGLNLDYKITQNWIANVGYKWEYFKPNIEISDIKIRTNGFTLGFSYRF